MAFGGFVDEFTNSPVQPAFSTYLGLSLTGNISLDWAQFTLTATNPFSQLIVVTANTSNINTIFMPDATLSSVQQTVILGNSSAIAYNVSDFDSNPLGTITPGEVWFYALTDNTTQAGTWFLTQFGGTIQPGDAAALVGPGYGLIALDGLIELNFLTVPIGIDAVPYDLTNTGRGRFHLWLAGNDDFYLPLANSVSNGFVFSIANQSAEVGGIANVTPAGADTINGETIAIEIKKNESTFLIGDGVSNWTTLARNQEFSQNFAQQTTPINAVSTTLTAAEANPEIQKFTNGSFGGTATVIFPATVPEFYIMWNARSANNNIIVQNAGSGLTYTLLSGETLSLYSDGIDLHPASNIFLGANGSAAKPAIAFENDPDTGFYRVGDNTLGLTTEGVQRLQFDNNGLHLTLSADTHTPTLSPIGTPSTGLSFPTATAMAYSVDGVNIFLIDDTDFNLTVPITVAPGTEADPSYSFTGFTGNGMWFDVPENALSFSVGGVTELFLSPLQSGTAAPFSTPNKLDDTTPTFNFETAPDWGMNYNSAASRLNLITAGVSALQISATQVVSLTNPLAPTSGGTGQSTYAVGDTLYASAINTLSKLAISATAGKALVRAAGSRIPAWSGLSILDIQQTVITATSTFTSATLIDIPTFTVTITPKSTNSKILVMCSINADVTQTHTFGFQLARNGTAIFQGDSSGYTAILQQNTPHSLTTIPILYLDSPASTDAQIYTIQGIIIGPATGYINQQQIGLYITASSMIVVEIGGN